MKMVVSNDDELYNNHWLSKDELYVQ
jgi:hypothetical protein